MSVGPMQYLGKSVLTGHPTFLFAKSSKPTVFQDQTHPIARPFCNVHESQGREEKSKFTVFSHAQIPKHWAKTERQDRWMICLVLGWLRSSPDASEQLLFSILAHVRGGRGGGGLTLDKQLSPTHSFTHSVIAVSHSLCARQVGSVAALKFFCLYGDDTLVSPKNSYVNILTPVPQM